jgi:hypothetical protein
LLKNNKLISGSEAAIEFNNYFISVANDITKNLGPVNNDVSHEFPIFYGSCFLFPTSELEIKKFLRLCKGKLLQIDEVQPRMLYLVADIVAPVLAHIFTYICPVECISIH